MARTWLQIRVDLVSGRGEPLRPAPGRIFVVGPSHTFSALADAINQAFARWDLSHLYEFELGDGIKIGFVDPDGFLILEDPRRQGRLGRDTPDGLDLEP